MHLFEDSDLPYGNHYFNGGWITQGGKFIECDHENDLHHDEIFIELMGNKLDFDHDYAREAGIEHGWIRVAGLVDPEGEFPIEIGQPLVTRKQWHRLDKIFQDEWMGQTILVELPERYYQFGNPRGAMNFLTHFIRRIDK